MFIKYDNNTYINNVKKDVREVGVPRGFEKYFIGIHFTQAQFDCALRLARSANDAFNNGILGKDKDFVTNSNRLLDELENYVSEVDPVGYFGCEVDAVPDFDDTTWGR